MEENNTGTGGSSVGELRGSEFRSRSLNVKVHVWWPGHATPAQEERTCWLTGLANPWSPSSVREEVQKYKLDNDLWPLHVHTHTHTSSSAQVCTHNHIPKRERKEKKEENAISNMAWSTGNLSSLSSEGWKSEIKVLAPCRGIHSRLVLLGPNHSWNPWPVISEYSSPISSSTATWHCSHASCLSVFLPILQRTTVTLG